MFLVRFGRQTSVLFSGLWSCVKRRQQLTKLVVRSKKKESSCEARFIQNSQHGDHLLIGHGDVVFFCREVNKGVLGKAGASNLKVRDVLTHGQAMKTVDEVERKGKLSIDKQRELDRMLGEEVLLRDREVTELAHPFALVDHGAKSFDVSRVSDPGKLGRLIEVKNISSVLGHHKNRDCKDPLGPSRKVIDKNLDYIFTFAELSG